MHGKGLAVTLLNFILNDQLASLLSVLIPSQSQPQAKNLNEMK